MKHISGGLLILAFLGAIGFAWWSIDMWEDVERAERQLQVLEGVFIRSQIPAACVVIAALLGYLTSFAGNRRKRPIFPIMLAFFGVGAVAGVLARESLNLFEFIREEVPRVDTIFWLCVLGGGIVGAALIMAFEAANRWAWTSLAETLDAREMGSAAIIASQVSLLFAPGNVATLRSVALARFRKGSRGDVVATLQSFYDLGQRDADLIEALAKAARENGDSNKYLAHLKELRGLFPDDAEIASILMEELLAQNHTREALGMMEMVGVEDDEESLERYAGLLLSEGHTDKAATVARRLGEKEGIPFRRSQKLLREVLNRAPENVAALNTLANHAERMALREQRLRWLERSFEVDPRQAEVRAALLHLYREAGDARRLEVLLADEVAANPREEALLLEFATVLHRNEKSEDALARLESLVNRAQPVPAAMLLQARIHYDAAAFDTARQILEKLIRLELDSRQREEAEQLLAKVEREVLSVETAQALEDAKANPDNADLQFRALRRVVEGGHTDKVLPLVDAVVSRSSDARDQVIAILQDAASKPGVPFPLLNLLADLLVARGRYDDALLVVRQMADRSMDTVGAMRDGAQKILRRSPHHLSTLRALGDVYLLHGRFTEMIHSYALYLAHGGEETEQIDLALAKAYLGLGDYDNAKRFVTQLLVLNPADVALLQQVIPLALEAGQAEEAADFLKKLEIAAPREPETKKLKERVNAGLGERRLAYLKKELEAGRGDAATLEQLGDIARDVGNFNDAITYFQRASRERDDEMRMKRCTAKLAQCYLKKRLDDLASETLRDLTISLEDEPEALASIMDILYEIGDLFLELKLYAKAERIFKQLCKIDAGYRDVLSKVESLRA
jgi:tetratricopeptide (TPR) repeat protein